MIVLGPGRDEDLKISPEQVTSRMKRNEALSEPTETLAIYLAEGQGMADGLTFASGSDLAYWLQQAIMFSICTLQEQGHLSKQLPKGKKKKDDDGPSVGQYL